MNILLLNQNWFTEEFRQMGHQVLSMGPGGNLDIVESTPLRSFFKTLEKAEGFEPELIIAYDNSAPLMFTRLDEIECPFIFYGIDTHHHIELHHYLSAATDYTFVAHKDYMTTFVEAGFCEPEWLPLWASKYIEPQKQKEYGAVFVGTMDRTLNPDRVEFFEKLQKLVDITCMSAPYETIFPKAEIVINQTVKGDLNFRVFETMMCGAALLTEDAGNGLKDLFTPGEHLFLYEKGNVEQAAQKISELLADIENTRRVAAQAREEIYAHHLPRHRAEHILNRAMEVNKATKTQSKRRFFGWLYNYHHLICALPEEENNLIRHGVVESLRVAQKAIQSAEVLDNTSAFCLIRAAMIFNHEFSGEDANNLMEMAYNSYPDNALLRAYRIHRLYKSGDLSKAQTLASQYYPEQSFEESVKSTEGAVTIIRQWKNGRWPIKAL